MTTFTPRIAVIGLGYVGLPVAVSFGRKFPGTVGFDLSAERIDGLKRGIDQTGEISSEELKGSSLTLSADEAVLRGANVFIVCVPTPIYDDKRPDLTPLESASEIVGRALTRGSVVIYESTVYPGLTEEYCVPILARVSGLTQGDGFKIGYSPERINPGDKEHTFESIKKVVAGEDAETLERVADLYSAVVKAGVHRATSIRVAEAAKVLENTQRDLNVALMNELAIICDRMNIRTRDVLDAAGTKWNFLKFSPGLVGGHCIGVDPYYLTAKAQQLGYYPEVILAGRRINDSMGAVIARRIVRLLGDGPRPLREARVGVLGLTFKENVPDIRNSRVPDILAELKQFGIQALSHDPLADGARVHHEYGFTPDSIGAFKDLDVLVLAVPHQEYVRHPEKLYAMLREGGAVVDIKSELKPHTVPKQLRYWSL